MDGNYFKRTLSYHCDLPDALSLYDEINRVLPLKQDKTLSNISVTVLGGGHKIGGTSILISIDDHHLLLDAGIHMDANEGVFPDYSALKELGLTLDDIDALVISHAHLDHTGAIPEVHRLAPNLPIFSTEATYELMSILLGDLCRNSQHIEGFYQENDLSAALYNVQTKKMNTTFMIPSKDHEWLITYYPAGHILGAAAIYIQMNDQSVLFTGDYSVEDQLTVRGIDLPKDLQVDVLITESTYGYLPSQAALPRKWQEEQLIRLIERTAGESGSVLIPAFALGRAQEILLILKEYMKKKGHWSFPIYIDGLVPEICKVYEKYLKSDPRRQMEKNIFFEEIEVVKEKYRGMDREEFLEYVLGIKRKVIIASSGMLQEGSASSQYASVILKEPENAIAFTGYLDEESPGFFVQQLQLQESPKIRLEGQDIEVKAQIRSFRLSAHASRDEMLQTILSVKPKVVLLVHGENDKQYKAPQAYESFIVYPTILQLLEGANIRVIPTQNGQTYFLSNKWR